MTDQKPNAPGQKHILVVDDNVELAQAYKELIETHGYRATVASNGVLALKMVLNVQVDAILCDLSMPQLEGDMFHVAVERVRPQLAKRFVFVTGHAGNPKYDAFLKEVKLPVLYKPVPMENLLAALRGVMSQPA